MASVSEMTPAGRNWVAAVLLFFGVFVLALAFGWIKTKPGSVHAPMWVLGSAGMTFNLAAVMVFLTGRKGMSMLQNLIVWLFLLALALPFNWVAFGEGERHFSGGVSSMGVSIHSTTSEGSGRFGFGIAAAIMDAILAWSLIRVLRGKPAFDPQKDA